MTCTFLSQASICAVAGTSGRWRQLRTYCRHRLNLVNNTADCTRKMQKYLRLLNIRLDIVVKDVTGLTGLAIIESICNGETNPETLAALRNGNCKKSETEIAKALQSNKRPDYLFTLRQELHLYKQYQHQIAACDIEIEKMIQQHIQIDEKKKTLQTTAKPHKRVNKNRKDKYQTKKLKMRKKAFSSPEAINRDMILKTINYFKQLYLQ